jgi:hypothetical protein
LRKYASNPVIDFLREKPYEHRVAVLPFAAPSQLSLFSQLYDIEWKQQLFPYNNIQTLDIIMMPRAPVDYMEFESAMSFDRTTNTLHRVTRRWELTNTRYLLGAAGFLDVLNQQIDPLQHRFRIATRFHIEGKPGIPNPTSLDELTAVITPEGEYAVFDFTGALPRAKLYAHWLVSTNDQTTLTNLASAEFDPQRSVLVTNPSVPNPQSSTNAGIVEFTSYAPKRIVSQAKAASPAVLLLNDKYNPDWKVSVDGKPETLLRCNYLMRGVYLQPGTPTVRVSLRTPYRHVLRQPRGGICRFLAGWLSSPWTREGTDSPEQVFRVRRIVTVVRQIIRQLVKLGVGVPKQHDLDPLASLFMPIAARVHDGAVGVPGPVALDDLGCGLARDFRAFDWVVGGIKPASAARDVLDTKRVDPPLHQVTVAPALPTGVRVRVHRVPLVGWAVKDFDILSIAVERAVGLPFCATIFPGVAAHVRCGWPLPTVGSPSIVNWKLVAGVIRIELKGDTDLVLVISALCPLGLDPGARERREQQRCQDSDDRDHHQQLDQRKAPWFACVFFAQWAWHVRFSNS